MAYFNILSCSVFILNLYLNRRGLYNIAIFFTSSEVTLHAVLAVYFLGWQSGFHYYIIDIIPLIFYVPYIKTVIKSFISLAILTLYLLLMFFNQRYGHSYIINDKILQAVNYINVFCGFFAIASINFFFDKAVKDSEKKLENQIKISDSLLLNILPKKIADKLKNQKGTLADKYSNTTILFVDIVGFTSLTEKSTPENLINLLNNIFSKFDDLTEIYGLEKIKTSGDSYMVAGGVPEPKEDHAEAIANMSLQIKFLIEKFNVKLGKNILNVRMGINSGPVIAGVIGKKKFIFDLWGDTVNVASRMESHGVIGEIQASEKTFNILKGKYIFENRGPLNIKGKGMMNTYLLKSAKK